MKSSKNLAAEINDLNRQIAELMEQRSRLEARLSKRKHAPASTRFTPFGLSTNEEISRQFYD